MQELDWLVLAVALGALTVGGVFFAFSSFVMPALAQLPAGEGVRAMQRINVVVLNRSFLGLFLGTAIGSIVVLGALLWREATVAPAALWVGAVSYLVGTLLVTRFGNIPLNNALAASEAQSAEAAVLWARYLNRWTLWNHLRTLNACIAGTAWVYWLATT